MSGVREGGRGGEGGSREERGEINSEVERKYMRNGEKKKGSKKREKVGK